MNLEPSDSGHPTDVVANHPRVVGLGRSEGEQRRVESFARDLARWLSGIPRSEVGPLARVITAVLHRELGDARAVCRGRPLLAVEAAARATEALWPLLRWEEPPAPDEEEAPDDEEGAEEGEEESSEEGEGTSEDGEGASESEEGEEDQEEGGDEDGVSEDEEGDSKDGEGGSDDEEGASDDGDGASEGEGATGAGVGGAGAAAGEPGEMGPGMTPDAVLAALAELGAVDDPELTGLAARLQERLGAKADPVQVGSALAEELAGAGEVATEGALQTDRVARHLERFLPGVGWSHAPGALDATLLQRLEGLTALLGQLDGLRELADRLGRLEEASRREGRQEGGREEVVGVRFGGDVANALPSELGLLGDPATEDLFYQRFVEHRLVTLELKGAGDEGVAMGEKRGPIIGCIDTSASMEGAPEMAAKALVLAVCRQALPRGRPVHLILFGGPRQSTEIRLRRGLGGLEGLVDFLQQSFSSGTDFDGPLLRAMELLEDQALRQADVLVVTDGLCRATPQVIERVEEVRQATGVRVWSVVLGRRDVRGVEPFSDEVWKLDPDADGETVALLRALRERPITP